ncbi:MAG: hypothetical protein ACJAQT_000544 [Akkermansiaceae bacterium]
MNFLKAETLDDFGSEHAGTGLGEVNDIPFFSLLTCSKPGIEVFEAMNGRLAIHGGRWTFARPFQSERTGRV